MNNDKKELEKLEQINLKFIKSLQEVIAPFVKRLETIHLNNIDLNADEKQKLINIRLLVKHYSEKEADSSNHLKGQNETYILRDIHCTLEAAMQLATDAEKGKLTLLYSDCEKLRADLLKIEEDILNQKN
jgi:hypothetical protein